MSEFRRRQAKFIEIAILIVFLISAVNTESLGVEYNAGVESIFSYGAGARAMGMGGAFVAIADDASAVYYNPAGISQLERAQFSGLHVTLWEGVNYDVINFVIPTLDYGSFGVGVMRIGVGEIMRRDQYNIKRGEFDYHQEQYLLSYSLHITENMSVGLTGKLSSQSLDNYNASGFAGDIGALFRIPGHPQLTLGLNIQELFASGMKLKSRNENDPTNLKVGLGYEILFGGLDNRIRFAVDVDKTERKDPITHFGAEADWGGNLFVRSGVEPSGVSFGGGVAVGFIGVDYAFINSEEMGDAHRFSLSMKFGKPLSLRLRERIAREESISEERFIIFSRREKLKNADYFLQRGDSLAFLGRLPDAEQAYKYALAWDPDYEPARQRLQDINPELEVMREEEKIGLRRSLEVEFTLERARQLAASEHYPDAIRELDDLLATDPHNSPAASLRSEYNLKLEQNIQTLKLNAYSYYKQKDYTNAYYEYQKLSQLQPDDPIVKGRLSEISNKLQAALHLKQGLQLFGEGNYSLSAVEFQLALQYDPEDNTCTEYLDRSQNNLAGTTTLKEIKENPQIWQLYLDGIAAYQEGDFQSAMSKWEKVLRDYPTNINTLINIEQARRLLKNSGER